MTNIAQTEASIRRAKAAQLRERAQEFARQRKAMLVADHPDRPWTQADEDSVQLAALEFVVSTERYGQYATAEALARDAGGAYLRMCLRETLHDQMEEHGNHDRAVAAVLSRIWEYFRKAQMCYRRRVTALDPMLGQFFDADYVRTLHERRDDTND